MAQVEQANPVLVEVWRGDSVESRHRGAFAAVAADGRLLASAGAVGVPVFPRSAVKPLQALALARSGAVARFALAPAELAIACGSHAGEAAHVRTVAGWLDRLGLADDALICGAPAPASEAAWRRLLAEGRPPGRLHNNCSGKHAGFLTLARQLGEPVAGYGEPGHPVQRQVRHVLAEYAGILPERLRPAIDGCGVPTFALPLDALALAFARLAAAGRRRPQDAAAAVICQAMAAHPANVAGEGRFDTVVIAASAGRILVKGGAEGMAAAALLDHGIGLALKIDDGGRRAVEAAMAALLARFAAPGAACRRVLAGWHSRPLRNTQDRVVGRIDTQAIGG
jgi:L-asparaginase II